MKSQTGDRGQDDALQWGHDVEVVEDLRRGRSLDFGLNLGFNGATTLKSWKIARAGLIEPRERMLQWGHDVEVVEDRRPRRSELDADRMLQWGHDVEVVEDR